MGTFFQWLIDILRDVRFWFIVDPWEKAVRVRLGKNTAVLGPGLHWKIPAVDEIYVVNTRLRLGPTSTQTISTKDGRVITVGVQIGFSIKDPLLALSAYQHPENSIAVLVHNHVAAYITEKSLEEILIPDLEDFIINGLKDSDPNNGMVVEFVKVTNFVASSAARTFRLVSDEIITDYYSDVKDRAKWQPHVTQW